MHVLVWYIATSRYEIASILQNGERLSMKAHFSIAVRSLTQLTAVSTLSLGLSGPGHAVDGCELLLCMAGNWQNISQCTPTVRQALRDVARGRGWPTCSMGGNSASGNQFVAPEQCPGQYITNLGADEGGRVLYSCPFSGVIHVVVDGRPWSRTWWSPSGDSVVEWLPAAKAAFASSPEAMDARFDRDYAAWNVNEQVRRAAAEAAAVIAASQGGGE